MRRPALIIAFVAFALTSLQFVNAQERTPGLVPIPEKRPHPYANRTPKAPPPPLRIRPESQRLPRIVLPKDSRNLALHKHVTSSDKEPIIGRLDQIADGNKKVEDGAFVELGPGSQWVQIDLGQTARLYAITVWRNAIDPRVYRDVVVWVSDDPMFRNHTVLFNNDFDNSQGLGPGTDWEERETLEGQWIPARNSKARYVRLYSKGNTADDQNHYTEVEVHGFVEEPKR